MRDLEDYVCFGTRCTPQDGVGAAARSETVGRCLNDIAAVEHTSDGDG